MAKLAINGGSPVRDKNRLFPAYNPIGKEEKDAAMRVLDSGILSNYIGGWEPMFYGGPEVQAFEKEWAAKVGAKFGIAMNSASSGLIAAMGAIGIEPGDEVIVAPFSMCSVCSSCSRRMRWWCGEPRTRLRWRRSWWKIWIRRGRRSSSISR